jgi:hypothetical protein
MQHHAMRSSTSLLARVVLDLHNARRGAAASAEGQAGTALLDDRMVQALRREQQAATERRIAQARRLRVAGTCTAYASTTAA